MKILLTILCAIMALFGGGCAVIAFGMSGGMSGLVELGPLIVIPLGIFLLNLFVLLALWGFSKPVSGVFVTLFVLDAIIAVGLGILWVAAGLMTEPDGWMGLLIAVAFAAKGYLTYRYWRDSRAAAV